MRWSELGINIPYGKTGGQVKTVCPVCRDSRHNKHDKSLSCDMATGLFKCHHCGYSGSAAPKRENPYVPFVNPRPLSGKKPVYKKPKQPPENVLSAKALNWFKGRGIGGETLKALRVTEGPEWMPQKDREVNTVQFNYYRNGELVNTKFRTGDKCFKLVSGAELILYNLDGIKGTKEAIVTEGEMDALSFYACGRTDVVSVPNGANANLSYLDDYIEEYFDGKETVYIAVDTDTRGVVLRDELIRRFGFERCRVMTYGEGCKDANGHLMKYGRESLLSYLAEAPEVRVEGVFRISDFEQSLDALFESGLQRGVTVGHANFDALCSFETKRLCLVTGIPGSGKSEFIDELAERLNIRHQWRFAYFSPENAPLAYHASKLIEKFTGKKFGSRTLGTGEYSRVKDHLEDNFFFISPPDNFKVDNILEKARYLVRRRGIKALVIDPYNRIESEQNARSETLYISELLDKLTNFAQINDALVILMAHPTKLKKNTDGKYEAPTLYDVSGSANFFNKADFGISVHRRREENYVEVHVQKVKFRHLGETGVCLFKYNINNGRYVPYDLNRPENVPWDNSSHLAEKISDSPRDGPEFPFDFDSPAGDCPY